MKRGWKRIGVTISVIWFVGFGFFLWHLSVEELVRPLTLGYEHCGRMLEIANDSLQYVKPVDRDRTQDENFAKYKKCQDEASANWHRTLPQTSTQAAVVLAADVVTILLGWLIVWGIVVVVRWIRRGFATP